MKSLLPFNDMHNTVRSEDVRGYDARSIDIECPKSVSGDEELRVCSCDETRASDQGGRVQHFSLANIIRRDLRRCNRCFVEG